MTKEILTADELRDLTEQPARSKYGSRRTYVPELERWFASRREADAAVTLRRREQAGEIRDLEFQPRYPIDVDGTVVCTYVADFRWRVFNADLGCWDTVVADAKGYRTPVYRLKKRLMHAALGIDVVEL